MSHIHTKLPLMQCIQFVNVVNLAVEPFLYDISVVDGMSSPLIMKQRGSYWVKFCVYIVYIHIQQKACDFTFQARTLNRFGRYCIGFAFDEIEKSTSHTLGFSIFKVEYFFYNLNDQIQTVNKSRFCFVKLHKFFRDVFAF